MCFHLLTFALGWSPRYSIVSTLVTRESIAFLLTGTECDNFASDLLPTTYPSTG
jgi:hypothetical protein